MRPTDYTPTRREVWDEIARELYEPVSRTARRLGSKAARRLREFSYGVAVGITTSAVIPSQNRFEWYKRNHEHPLTNYHIAGAVIGFLGTPVLAIGAPIFQYPRTGNFDPLPIVVYASTNAASGLIELVDKKYNSVKNRLAEEHKSERENAHDSVAAESRRRPRRR